MQAVRVGVAGTVAVLIEWVLHQAATKTTLQALARAIMLSCVVVASVAWRCTGALTTMWAVLPVALACGHGVTSKVPGLVHLGKAPWVSGCTIMVLLQRTEV